MSKLSGIVQHYNNLGMSYAAADAAVESSFNSRERHDDDELDTLAFQCAYLDGIARSGWTQADYEYVFNRADETFNEEAYLKETHNGEYGYVDGEEYGDYPYYQRGGQEEEEYPLERDPAGCLGYPEAGGGSLGSSKGQRGSVDLLDAEPCTFSPAGNRECEWQEQDADCATSATVQP